MDSKNLPIATPVQIRYCKPPGTKYPPRQCGNLTDRSPNTSTGLLDSPEIEPGKVRRVLAANSLRGGAAGTQNMRVGFVPNA